MDQAEWWNTYAVVVGALDCMQCAVDKMRVQLETLAEHQSHLEAVPLNPEEQEDGDLSRMQRSDHVGSDAGGGERPAGRSRAEGLWTWTLPGGDGRSEADGATDRREQSTSDAGGSSDHLPATAGHLVAVEFVYILGGPYEGRSGRLMQIVDPSGFGMFFGDVGVLDDAGAIVDKVRVRVRLLRAL